MVTGPLDSNGNIKMDIEDVKGNIISSSNPLNSNSNLV